MPKEWREAATSWSMGEAASNADEEQYGLESNGIHSSLPSLNDFFSLNNLTNCHSKLHYSDQKIDKIIYDTLLCSLRG